MTKITKVSKKAISMILVMLMAFSCMGITAFAEVTPTAPAAPSAIVVTGKIGTAISIEAIEGGEYAIVENTADAVAPEADAYGTDTLFSGLKADTEYKIYARIAAKGETPCSEAATITEKTYAKDPEIVISADDITVDHIEKTITCVNAADYVYADGDGKSYKVRYVIVGSDKEPIGIEGNAVMFYNLYSGTTYKIAGRITIGGMDITGDAIDCTLKAEQNAPTTPVPVKVTDTSIEIQKIDNDAVYAFALKGAADSEFVYDTKTKFEDLTPGETYVIRAKYEETETRLESPVSYVEIDTKKESKGTAPAPVLADKTNTTIKVAAGAGSAYKCEFSIDNGATWDDDGLFIGLTPNKKYTFVARYIYDDAKEAASGISEPISIFTNTRVNYEASLNKCSLSIPADEINAKENFNVTANGDMYGETAQYGDTRYVAYKITYGDVTKINETGVSSSLSATLTAPDSAQDIKVTVVYRLQRCTYVDDDGTSSWVYVTGNDGKIIEKTQQYDVHVAEEYNAVKAFFISILNFLLDTLPSLILSLFGK